MTNIRLRDIEGYENFKAECDFFRCEEEYPGWTGTEKYIIISDCSEEVLMAKYPLVIEAMRPFMIVSESYGTIRKESNNTERRIKRFAMTHETIFDFDEETECCNEELIDFKTCEQIDLNLELQEALSVLTEVQRERIVKYYLQGMTFSEIARSENKNYKSVRDSVIQGIEKMKNFLT